MKKLFLFLLFISVSIISCNVQENPSTNVLSLEVTSSSDPEGHVGSVNILFEKPIVDTTSLFFSLDGIAEQGVDYILDFDSPIIIYPGAEESILNYELIDDSFVEAEESFIITIDNISGDDIKIDQESIYTQTIIDNDVYAILSFSTPILIEEYESNSSYEVKIELSRELVEDLNFNIIVSGEATIDEDYSLITEIGSISEPLLIPAGELQTLVTLNVLEDDKVEIDENIILELSNAHNADVKIETDEQFIHVIMNNDDPAIIEIEQSDDVVRDFEITTHIVNISFSRALRESIILDVVLTGDAIEGEDYKLNTQFPLTLDAGTLDASISFDILANDANESRELFQFEIKVEEGLDAIVGNLSTYGITIVSDRDISGEYNIVNSAYYRLGGVQESFIGLIRKIEYIDETTYKMTDFGPWVDDRNFLYFTIDGNDVITVPKNYPASSGLTGIQLLWGTDEIQICDLGETPIIQDEFGCNSKVIRDVNRNDVIEISYGYFRAGSGLREFYEKLVRR